MRRVFLLLLFCFVLLIGTSIFVAEASYDSKCFFSVEKSASGAWWFVDPNGDPFFSMGVDSVQYWGITDVNNNNIYYDTVTAKFASQDAWADSAIARLNSWNFNTLGAWADDYIVTKGALPYTVFLNFQGNFGSWLDGVFPDVFNQAWIDYTVDTARTVCGPVRNDPNLLGYYLDNELFWGPSIQGWADWRSNKTLLDMFLGFSTAGKQRAITYLQTKYSSIAALNSAWNTTYTSFTNMSPLPPPKATVAHTTDANEFAGIVATQYFSQTAAAIRAIDDNHLILGCKYGFTPAAEILAANGKYNDVISLDYYTDTPVQSDIDIITQYANKPVLIGEYAFRALDSGLPCTKGAGPLYNTQAQRAASFQNYSAVLGPSKNIVGLHWFMWQDEPAAGRSLDGENSNYGCVNGTDVTYTTLTNMMTSVNAQLPAMHEANPSKFKAQCKSKLTCPNNCAGHGCCESSTGVCHCDSGYTSADCSIDNSAFSAPSFSLPLNTTYAITDNGGWNLQYFFDAQTTVQNGMLHLAIDNSGCPSNCAGFSFKSGGARTQAVFGYGTYKANMSISGSNNFTVSFELNSVAQPRDTVSLHVSGSSNFISLDSFVNGTYQYLQYVPLANYSSASGFHSYEIHYYPTYLSFFVDNTQVAYVNSTPIGLPAKEVYIWFYLTALGTTGGNSASANIASTSFAQAFHNKGECTQGDDDMSEASRILATSTLTSDVASWMYHHLPL